MNESLRDALDNIFDARVPTVWLKGSWTSSTLGFWFTELIDRNKQFSTWCFQVLRKKDNQAKARRIITHTYKRPQGQMTHEQKLT